MFEQYSDRVTGRLVDMGTDFDRFGPLLNPLNPTTTGAVLPNGLLLKSSMNEQGFRKLSEEWWHSTPVDEPNGDACCDVAVR